MEVPPGLVYFSARIPRLLLPPVCVYLYNWVFQPHVPKWVLILSYFLSFPAALIISVCLVDIRRNIEARRLGAIFAPRIPDWTPGSLKTIWQLVKGMKSGDPIEGFTKKVEQFGYTFIMRVLFQDRVITMEPEHLKAILATQFDEFEKGDELRSTMHSLLGTGVFAADGELWKFHRTMTRPFFSKDRISHFDIFDRHADSAINKMKQRFLEGFPVDFQDMAARFTLDSATEFLFGHDVCSLSANLPYPFYASLSLKSATESKSDAFVKAFSEAQQSTASRMKFNSNWPLMEFWKDKTKAHMKIVRQTLDPILKQAVENRKKRGEMKTDSHEAETLLEHLVDYTEDYTILRDEIMNLGVAGRDTTACTLTFAVYMLSEHPQVFHRLREEILTKIGPSRRPTFDDFRDMRYLRAVINETLRLYPPVPFNIRVAKKGTTLPNKPGQKPFYVGAQVRIAYSVFAMHRREDLWGPDALFFDPDRFLDERLHKYLTPNPFIFLPFNAGPRICLGQQFAYHEVSFFLVRLLQHFSKIRLETEAVPPAGRPPNSWKKEGGIKAREKVKIGSHLTMYVMEGLWVTMEEAAVDDGQHSA